MLCLSYIQVLNDLFLGPASRPRSHSGDYCCLHRLDHGRSQAGYSDQLSPASIDLDSQHVSGTVQGYLDRTGVVTSYDLGSSRVGRS
ncbi:hypothetical protein [Salinispora pacifica]|uniref:hypothetical protein n=1 Tax=Salinispora pacifica TaxID=351187 RepID=UPI00037F6A48|nr:hypothetical protein [Salinispora pacifica]